MYKYTSGRVKKTPQTGITSDRYQFLGLDQAEPDLGDPLVGPSSIGANPYPPSGTQYVLVANSNNLGKRYWTISTNISGSGLIPGSVSVFDDGSQIGAASSFTKFNFVGSNVSVDFVSSDVDKQTGVATVRISDTPTFSALNVSGISTFTGIATHTAPIYGTDSRFVGVVTSINGFVGNLTGDVTGTATTATNLSNAANITTGTIGVSRLSGEYDISITGTSQYAVYVYDAGDILAGTISADRLSGSYSIDITGTATTATNLSDAANITTGTISSSRLSGSYGISITGNSATSTNATTAGISTNVIGGIGSITQLRVSGLSTFTNGPVLIGTGSSTGTASQPLQVTGGAYVSDKLGIGNTNPATPLQVETFGVKTGVGTFIASVGVATSIDSFNVSSTDFKTAEYTIHIGVGTYTQAQKVLVMQDKSTAYSQEYAVMFNNSLIVAIGATISGSNCVIQVTPQTGISGLTTYRFIRNTLL